MARFTKEDNIQRRFTSNEYKYYTPNYLGTLTKLLGAILCFLLLVSLYRASIGGAMPTFTGLLEIIESVPLFQISDLSTILSDSLISANWGAFEFLRNFLLIFVTAIDFVIWLLNMTLLVVQYLMHFIRWIFVIA